MKLFIRNFQNISEATINLEGFTVFTGKTNSGKSSIRRAIECVLYNVWDKGHIKKDAEDCLIRLTIDSDNWVQITKPENSYTVVVNGEKSIYPKVGKASLEELCDFSLDKFLDSEGYEHSVHIRSQTDPWFYISYSKQEQARIIASMFNFDRIKTVLKQSYTERQSVNKSVELTLSGLDKLKVELSNLEGRESLLTYLEKKMTKKSRIESFLGLSTDMNSSFSSVQKCSKELSLVDAISTSLYLLRTLSEWTQHTALYGESNSRCGNLLSELDITNLEILSYQSLLSSMEKLNTLNSYFNLKKTKYDVMLSISEKGAKSFNISKWIEQHQTALINSENKFIISKYLEIERNQYQTIRRITDLTEQLELTSKLKNNCTRVDSLTRHIDRLNESKSLQMDMKLTDFAISFTEDNLDKLYLCSELNGLLVLQEKRLGLEIKGFNRQCEIDEAQFKISEYKGKLKALIVCPECNALIGDLID